MRRLAKVPFRWFTKRGLGTMVAALAAAALLSPATAVAAPETPPSSPAARAIVAAMQPGFGLGNTYDAVGADETAWGNPPVTRDLIRKIRSQGYRSIRIPVTWDGRQGGAPGYTIDPAWLAKVHRTVDWALAEGLHVMINVHHDSWLWINQYGTNRDLVRARFAATWTQLAAAFRTSSTRLVFESVNEPDFPGNITEEQKYQYLDELNTEFRRIVRASGGRNAKRLLVLPTIFCAPDQSRLDALAASLAGLNDPMIATTVHFYGFWPFSVNIANFTRFDDRSIQDLTGMFDRIHTTLIAKGVPVIIGEYALFGIDPNYPGIVERGEMRKFFELFGHHARRTRATTISWDAGQFLNRRTLQWRDPELFGQIKSSWTTRSGTASTDLVFNPPTGPLADQRLTLNENGTDFQGLRHGNRGLAEGRDYTLDGDQLTLTAAALTKLVGDRKYGVNATLYARFSRGAPWRIDIITSGTPQLSDAAGTTSCPADQWHSCLAVPTDFRGDVLSTMAAQYDDGTNAGPADWTAFQQYGAAFWADLPNGAINLTAGLVNSLVDGRPATLTFHFWSGATTTYRVLKSGTTVTGTTA